MDLYVIAVLMTSVAGAAAELVLAMLGSGTFAVIDNAFLPIVSHQQAKTAGFRATGGVPVTDSAQPGDGICARWRALCYADTYLIGQGVSVRQPATRNHLSSLHVVDSHEWRFYRYR